MAELKPFGDWLKAEIARLNRKLSKGPQSGYPEMYTKCETLELILRRWNRRTSPAMTEGCEHTWQTPMFKVERCRDCGKLRELAYPPT